MRKVDVVAVVDGSSCLLYGGLKSRNLVDGGIVAHHHTVEANIATKDILKDLAVGHTPGAMDVVITGHYGHTTRETDHRLMGEQDLFHQFLLLGIAATAVTQIVLRTGANAFLQVTLLQTLHEGCTHDGREITILAIRLFQAVKAGITTHVDHGRKGKDTSYLAQGRTRLERLQFSQLGVERTGLPYLLRVDGRA